MAGTADTQYIRDDFAAAFEAEFARLQARVETACANQWEWPARIAAGIRAAFAFAADHPHAARLLTTEALASGEKGQLLHGRMISYFAAGLLPGRELDPRNEDLPTILESAMAGGVALVIGRRLDHGREGELPLAAVEAIEFVLTPYVGIDEARRISRKHSDSGL